MSSIDKVTAAESSFTPQLVGTWEWDPADNTSRLSPELFRLFGTSAFDPTMLKYGLPGYFLLIGQMFSRRCKKEPRPVTWNLNTGISTLRLVYGGYIAEAPDFTTSRAYSG